MTCLKPFDSPCWCCSRERPQDCIHRCFNIMPIIKRIRGTHPHNNQLPHPLKTPSTLITSGPSGYCGTPRPIVNCCDGGCVRCNSGAAAGVDLHVSWFAGDV